MGSESWEAADPAISLAMRELADPSGPSAPILDGKAYSREGLWEDALVWASQVGPEVNAK